MKKLLLPAVALIAVWAVMTGPAAMLLEKAYLSGLTTPLLLLLLLAGWPLTTFMLHAAKRPRSR